MRVGSHVYGPALGLQRNLLQSYAQFSLASTRLSTTALTGARHRMIGGLLGQS